MQTISIYQTIILKGGENNICNYIRQITNLYVYINIIATFKIATFIQRPIILLEIFLILNTFISY